MATLARLFSAVLLSRNLLFRNWPTPFKKWRSSLVTFFCFLQNAIWFQSFTSALCEDSCSIVIRRSSSSAAWRAFIRDSSWDKRHLSWSTWRVCSRMCSSILETRPVRQKKCAFGWWDNLLSKICYFQFFSYLPRTSDDVYLPCNLVLSSSFSDCCLCNLSCSCFK